MINFLAKDFGVQRVCDFNIKILGPGDGHPDYFVNKTVDPNASLVNANIFDFENEQNAQILKEVDPFATSLLVKILERKTMLVNELKTLNDLAEKKRDALNENFFEDFGWIGNQVNSIDHVLKHVTAKFRLRGFNDENSQKIQKNFENIFNIFKKNIEREIEGTTSGSQKEELMEGRDFLTQSLDVNYPIFCNFQENIIRDILKNMKQVLPQDSIKLLEETIETVQDDEEEKTGDINALRAGEKPVKIEKIMVDSGKSPFNVRKGMNSQEKSHLMQLILDCGGILRTLISTHDINLKDNVFLQNLFSLAREHKKECHEISNVLVSLSSKIKSVH